MTEAAELQLRFPLPFWTPDTPDLGCFVRRDHEFRPDYNFFLWMEPVPWELPPSGPVVSLSWQLPVPSWGSSSLEASHPADACSPAAAAVRTSDRRREDVRGKAQVSQDLLGLEQICGPQL